MTEGGADNTTYYFITGNYMYKISNVCLTEVNVYVDIEKLFRVFFFVPE